MKPSELQTGQRRRLYWNRGLLRRCCSTWACLIVMGWNLFHSSRISPPRRSLSYPLEVTFPKKWQRWTSVLLVPWAGQHPGRPSPSGHRVLDPHRYLDRPVAGFSDHRIGRPQSVARHPYWGSSGRPGVGDPHELQRCCGVPNEQFGGLRRGHLHASNLRASHPGWGCDRRPRD